MKKEYNKPQIELIQAETICFLSASIIIDCSISGNDQFSNEEQFDNVWSDY